MLLSVFPRPLHDNLMWWYCRFVEAICSRFFHDFSGCLLCFCCFLLAVLPFFFPPSLFWERDLWRWVMCHTHGEGSYFCFPVRRVESSRAFCLEMFHHKQSCVSELWMEKLLKQEQILQLPPEMDWKRQTTWVVAVAKYEGSLARLAASLLLHLVIVTVQQLGSSSSHPLKNWCCGAI